MPTYIYQCSECKEEREMSHPINLPIVGVTCDCGKIMKKKPAYCSPVHFKGSGFYETDYKKNKDI